MVGSSSPLRGAVKRNLSIVSLVKQKAAPLPHYKRFKLLFYLFLISAAVIAVAYLRVILSILSSPSSNNGVTVNNKLQPNEIAISDHIATIASMVEEQPIEQRCAINFFGLPRAFELLVLPSIVKHVIDVNVECDYYVHYYHMTEEAAGRSGGGGAIDPTAILLLKEAVLQAAALRKESRTPIVEFVFDKEEDFWKRYTELIEKIRNTKVGGKYLYFPWKAKTYKHSVTTDNIVKMWHSIQSVHELMERIALAHNIRYQTVAMLRSDVVYVTPINVRDQTSSSDGSDKGSVTVPDFGKYPVSDRIIYGSAEAVKIWSTTRFASLESHVQLVQATDPGWGMHSERYLNTSIFPAIRQLGVSIRPHATLCFLRARADETVWVSDCDGTPPVSAKSIVQSMGAGGVRAALEATIGRPCSGKIVKIRANVKALDCSLNK